MKNIKETYEFDAIIIGAGIIGLAIACELRSKFENILLIEKEPTFGRHISSRNSEVIHSGIYYKTNSLKAKLCFEGNQLIYDFAKKYSIDHQNCGKIIIASNENEIEQLERLRINGLENGLEELIILSKNEISKREPVIKAAAGLWVPSSGIIDSHGMMHKLEYLAKSKNCTIVYNTEVEDINFQNNMYNLTFKDLAYQATSKIIINSAGLFCDKVSSMIGMDNHKLHYCKGEYYKTSLYRNKIHSLIYPIPTDISLGIHVVLHLDGTIGFGPNAYFVDEINYKLDTIHKKDFLMNIKKYLDLDEDDLSEDFAGIRPKLQKKGETDFIIRNETEKGYNNFINLIGIDSPGLTSSLAISKYVKSIIN